MKHFYTIAIAIAAIFCSQSTSAQTGTLSDGNKGPNLLGARGTFSVPYITVNKQAASCLQTGGSTYSPAGNIGNELDGCKNPSSNIFPCSDYTYTAKKNGMQPEFTYSIMKVMGNASGSNCLHDKIWTGKNHTQDQYGNDDGGYFMAVNGAPDIKKSPIFYQIKSIPICSGGTYEFSAYVMNMMPGVGPDNASPNISFIVNGTDTICTSGPIERGAKWIKVGGTFVAKSDKVDLKMVNSTAVADGNDLGLDDISITVTNSKITVTPSTATYEGNSVSPTFTVVDSTDLNTWYKWQLSKDGGITFSDITTGDQTTYINHKFVLTYPINNITAKMNGYMYRLVVSTSQSALSNPQCIYFNDYVLIVAPEGAPLPIQLTSFTGTYSEGIATLNWQTSQEINNDRFELFRSFDGSDFELAGTIAGAGNSYSVKNYRYQDRVNLSGNIFYKLKQIDKDGNFSFSQIVRLSAKSANASFQIYPNPVVSNFTASFSATKTGKAMLLIRNTNGQTVYTQTIDVIKGNNAQTINAPQLKTGMYYVSVVNDEINYNAKMQKM